jgi:hypothetical protein
MQFVQFERGRQVNLQEITRFLQDAFESSIHLSPTDPGLTYEELREVGTWAELTAAEIDDALKSISPDRSNTRSPKLLPSGGMLAMLGHLSIAKQPEYRQIGAFDFLHAQLNAAVKAQGADNAQLSRNVIVERAVAAGISDLHIQAAITICALSQQAVVDGDRVKAAPGWRYEQLPSQQLRTMPSPPINRFSEARGRAYAIVKDIIERRTDGRPKNAEPFDAFAEALDQLGYGHFRLWWTQAVAELRRTEPNSSPLSALVLAAALVEGSLTFVVKHARALSLGVFRSSDFDGEPSSWRIDKLVASAAHGGKDAIFDERMRSSAKRLVDTRQRIHAGRMLSDFPSGVPDLRPEEARAAITTAEDVVRRVLDWLERYPPQK